MSLLQTLRQRHALLRGILESNIQRGISPDIAAAHVVSAAQARDLGLEHEVLRPSISGTRIKRYQPCVSDQLLIYTHRDLDIREYPKTHRYLQTFRPRNTCKEVSANKHPWWSLHRPRNPAIFASPKLIGLTTSKTIELVHDERGSLYVTDAMYVFRLKPEVDPTLCLAIMQSRLFLFLYRTANQGESRVIPQVKASKLYDLPFPDCLTMKTQREQVREEVKHITSLQRRVDGSRTAHERKIVERQIDATDRRIDELVYELYGLTDKEIRIVEEATTRT